MTNKEGKSSKLSAAIERLAKLGLKVTNGTCKGKAIGIVGGVRRPKRESADRRKVLSESRTFSRLIFRDRTKATSEPTKPQVWTLHFTSRS